MDEKYKEKALIIAKKIISIYDLLDKINYEPKANWKKYNITIHYPCHTRNTKDKKIMTKLVKKIPNSKFVVHEDYVYMNPGSASIPKENSPHSYMIYEDGKFVWKNLESGEEYKPY